MDRQEWLRRKGPGGSLQRTLRSLGRIVHVSCDARMRENPKDPNGPWIPYIGPGSTLNTGRNKAKRERQS